MTLTGNAATDAMVAPSTDLIWAVRKNDADAVTDAFREAALHTGGDFYRAAIGLALTLAAMVPDDVRAGELLAWTAADRDRYLELRYAGLASAEAAAKATPTPTAPEFVGRVVPIRRGR